LAKEQFIVSDENGVQNWPSFALLDTLDV